MDVDIAEMVALEAYEEALRLQKIFNFYDPKSELSLLNTKRKLDCSPEMVDVLNSALFYCEQTKGLYDISLGKLFLNRKQKQSEPKLECSYHDISAHKNTVVLQHDDVLIDLGSIAKGYIVDKIVEFLQNSGVESGLVNGRGDIRVFGEHIFEIDIQHPRDKNKIITTLSIQNESIATSGDYNQYALSYKTSHIIHNNRFSSVTVITKELKTADVIATVISVLDEEHAEAFITAQLDTNNEMRIMTITKQLQQKQYNFEDKI